MDPTAADGVDSEPTKMASSRHGDMATAPRTVVLWAAIRDLLAHLTNGPGSNQQLTVLDVGGGTGGMAVSLAALGHRVTVVDPSLDALAAFTRRASEAGVNDLVHAVQADTTQLQELIDPASVDLVCCHEVLEYVDDPASAMAAVAAVLRPGGAVSVLVAQRSATVVARALAGRFAEASRALDDPDGRWGAGDPLPRRFDLEQVSGLISSAQLQLHRVHGVRLFSDLVPQALVDSREAREMLVQLERRASAHPQHPALSLLAAQLHVVAVHP